ncbi:hypothetical protein L210DRAFT_3572608, partial [Boletus edulis BED1]
MVPSHSGQTRAHSFSVSGLDVKKVLWDSRIVWHPKYSILGPNPSSLRRSNTRPSLSF